MKFCINIATNDRKLFVSRQLLCFRDQSSLPNVGFVHTLYSSNFKEFELNGTNWLAGSPPAMMEMPRNARRALRPSLNFPCSGIVLGLPPALERSRAGGAVVDQRFLCRDKSQDKQGCVRPQSALEAFILRRQLGKGKEESSV